MMLSASQTLPLPPVLPFSTSWKTSLLRFSRHAANKNLRHWKANLNRCCLKALLKKLKTKLLNKPVTLKKQKNNSAYYSAPPGNGGFLVAAKKYALLSLSVTHTSLALGLVIIA